MAQAIWGDRANGLTQRNALAVDPGRERSIADNLSKAGWSWGGISSMDHEGRQFWVAAAECENAGRFVVRADEKLTAFLELEAAIHRQPERG